MAYLNIRELKDNESNIFLKSKGFINIEGLNENSCWLGSDLSLTLPDSKIIRSDYSLYSTILEMGRSQGYEKCKSEMSNNIRLAIDNLINGNNKSIDNTELSEYNASL